MAKIKVGVVGTGFIGPAHIEALRRLPNIEVAALCGSTIESATVKASKLGIERACAFEELLAMEDIASVHICTPNVLHHPQAKAALSAGKHVVCEKPLAKDLHDAEELVALATTTGLVNAVHFNLRYYPLVRQMKTMREKGDLGEIYSVIGSYLQDWLFFDTDYNWRLEPEKSGNSRAIADIGSHLLDIIEYVTGLKTTLAYPEASSIMTFPGVHNEGFPDTSKQLFKEVYQAVAAGKQPESPSFPTFADGDRELLICERILESMCRARSQHSSFAGRGRGGRCERL